MAKVKTYLRVAKTARGYKVVATTKSSPANLSDDSWPRNKALPTVGFTAVFDIPDEAFNQASKVVEVDVPKDKLLVTAKVK